jgi:uncharacterized membrane protein
MNRRTQISPVQLAASAVLGALAMYMLEPQRARQRRAAALNAPSPMAERALPESASEAYDPVERRIHAANASVPRSSRGLGLLTLLSGVGLMAFYAWRRFNNGQLSSGSGLDASQTIEINASPERVFDLWSDYENFPHFMANVEEVRPLDGNRSHWIVKGPVGTRVEFDSVLVQSQRPRVLAWRSEPGSPVQNDGMVRLEPSAVGTRAIVRLRYQPSGGALGHAVASLFGRNPIQELADDLQRMKTFIETGIPTGGSARGTTVFPLGTARQTKSERSGAAR